MLGKDEIFWHGTSGGKRAVYGSKLKEYKKEFEDQEEKAFLALGAVQNKFTNPSLAELAKSDYDYFVKAYNAMQTTYSGVTIYDDYKYGSGMDSTISTYSKDGGNALNLESTGHHGYNEGIPQHATGLYSVPYDGYTAALHRGETILDAATTRNAREGNPASLSKYGINTQSATGVDSAGTTVTLQLKIVTPDGRVLKEEIMKDILTKSRFGEKVIFV